MCREPTEQVNIVIVIVLGESEKKMFRCVLVCVCVGGWERREEEVGWEEGAGERRGGRGEEEEGVVVYGGGGGVGKE